MTLHRTSVGPLPVSALEADTEPRASTGAAAKRRRATIGSAYDPRSNNFDVIRFGLASTVIWSHCFPLTGRAMDPIFATSLQIDGGSLAVDGFFIVSGFLITQSWISDPEWRAFAVKRALRIVPALVLAVVFGAFVVAPISYDGPLPSYYGSAAPWMHFAGVALHRYLFIPGTFVANPIPTLVNSPLWSLRYEMLCYAAVALIALAHRGRSFATSVAVLFLIAWIGAATIDPAQHVLSMTARLFTCFSAGMLLFLWRDQIPLAPAAIVAAVAVLAACFLWTGFHAAFPIVGGYLLLAIAAARTLPLQRWGRFGDFSYGLYVFAYPIQQTLVRLLGPDVPVPSMFVLSLALTLPIAALSWRFVEAPAIAMKRRLAPRRSATS